MFGYPGAGKTTVAEIIFKLTGAVHLASDRIRLELFKQPQFTQQEHQALYQAIDSKTSRLLREGKSVIYDANLNRYIHRKEKYDICRETSATPVLIWVQTDRGLAKQRATHDAHDDPRRPYGNLDEQTFDRLTREIEPPKPGENFIAIDGSKVTVGYIKSIIDSINKPL